MDDKKILKKKVVSKTRKNQPQDHKKEEIKTYIFKNNENISSLSNFFGIDQKVLIQKLEDLGIKKDFHNSLEKDIVELLCSEFNVKFINQKNIYSQTKNKKLVKRTPIVTIMGHVNHGKTTLLDTIRKTRLVMKEFGGITQHIGAYQTKYKDNLITFIDTPGHAIFNQMRARGAKFTDICVLILAVDDGIKPQTVEALNHAKKAKVPIIVALNKIDKLGNNNLETIMSELANYDLLPEIWGGNTPYVEISALKNKGIDKLLEVILLISEIENYQTEINVPAEGHVLESNLNKSQGPIATFIVKKGVLNIGDVVVVGNTYGKIRSIENDLKQKLKKSFPSQPVKIAGLKNVAEVGDLFVVVDNEIMAKQIIAQRKKQIPEDLVQENKFSDLKNFLNNMENEDIKYLNIVLKADYQGSLEAIKGILGKISFSNVQLQFIKTGVGDISENDVNLGQLNNSLIIGFNVSANVFVRNLAKSKGINIHLYNIVYRIFEDVEKNMKSLLKDTFQEKVIGQAQVKKIFQISKIGTIAGCYVISGMVTNDSLLRVLRDNNVIHKGKIISLKHLKNDIKISKKGHECGILIENFSNFQIDDIIEAYKLEKVEH